MHTKRFQCYSDQKVTKSSKSYHRSGLYLVVVSLVLCLVSATTASAIKFTKGFDANGLPGQIGPVVPPVDTGVHAPQDFTISGRGTTQVSLRWWNNGAPQTLISRSVNGGPWTVIKTFGQLTVNAYIDFQDLNATINAENCYVISVNDGANAFSTLATPQRCAFTRDGRDLPVHRLQFRIRVPNVSGAATDDDVEIRLQTPSWLIPAVTNWSPAGNSTWIDSTSNDFERGSDHTYDLMLTKVSQVSDITMITISKTGNDDMCVAELALLVDGQPAFQKTFGDTAATCAWVTAGTVLTIDFNELRTSPLWTHLSLPTFVGIDGAGLRSVIETIFAHNLHGQGELRNGGTTTSQRMSETKVHVTVPIVVYDVPILGDVDSDVHFDLVMTPTVVNGNPQAEISIQNPDADSSDFLGWFLPILGWKILNDTSDTIESKLADFDPFTIDHSPVPGTHVCFTPDAGIGVCFDTSARKAQATFLAR